MTNSWPVVVCAVLAVGCADADTDAEIQAEQQQAALRADGLRTLPRVLRRLNAIGTRHTGFTYSLGPPTPPVDGPTLVLDSDPVEGLMRRHRFQDVDDQFDLDVFDYPPGPTYPPGPSLPPGPTFPPGPIFPPGPSKVVHAGAPGRAPLVTLAGPVPAADEVAFRIDGANFKVVGSATIVDSQVTFDVFDADGRLVGSFGR
jgi:hypothetical protein